MMWAWLGAAAFGQVWVASTDGSLSRLERVARQAERRGAVVEPLHAGARCLRFEEAPDERWSQRVGRRLGTPLQERLECAIARFPLGRGFVAAVVDPHPDLEQRVADVVAPLTMSVLSQPLDGRPATLCVSGLQVDHDHLKADLQAVGLSVQGLYEVGSCEAVSVRRASWTAYRR
jgi:hypothetical protein